MSHNQIPDYHLEEEFLARQKPFPEASLWESQDSRYAFDYRNPYVPATGIVMAPSYSGGSTESTSSKDSGYGSAPSSTSSRELSYGRPHSAYDVLRRDYTRAGVRSGYLRCRHSGCEYQTKRQYDLDLHQKTHFPLQEKIDCPGRGCVRTGEHGFDRVDHLREHLRKVHQKDSPTHNKRRDPPEDIGRYNANVEAPSERLRSPSSQSPYVAEKSPDTASDIENSISHGMGEVNKKSPSSTDLKSVRDVQVAPEPKITHGKSISQSVKPGYEDNGLNPNKIERRSSTISADVERSRMRVTGECGAQDAVKPAEIISKLDNDFPPSILDHSVHTIPLAVMDADDEFMSSLSDEGTPLTVMDTDNESMSSSSDEGTPLTVMDADDEIIISLSDKGSEQAQYVDDGNEIYDSLGNLKFFDQPANVMMVESDAKTFIPGEPIETAKDIDRHQKSLELSEAIIDFDDTGMPRSSVYPGKRISDHTHPVGPSENTAKVKDAAQMNTSASLVEAVNDQTPHLPHDAQANTKPVRTAPQYDAYVMTLLSLRIELRVWLGRRAPSPTIHISTNGERPLEDGKQRIRWTCRCGRRLYDDFEELRPGALEELEQMLNEQNRIHSPDGNGSGQHRGSSIRALWNAAGGIIGSLNGSGPFRKNNPPSLPLHQHHAASQERNSQCTATWENLFLLMCIPYRKHGTRLVHMNLAELVSDETLFRKLRHEYQSIRGQWASYFSLWKMTEIQFVKFGLHKNQLIDIKEKNDLPPASLKDEYRYQPIPAETIPPIGTNHLMHLYEHPDHADDVPFCLERMPKKLREQLQLSPQQAPGLLGWGVYFAEGFDWPKFWVFGSVILSLSVLFGVCWSTLRHDIQGGFGVTACMMVAVTFTTGVVQAAVEQT